MASHTAHSNLQSNSDQAVIQESPPLTLLTWNALAPVYFRDGSDVEADDTPAYVARNARICEAICAVNADVVCLQEFWFDPGIIKMYQDKLGAKGYHYEALRRTSFNCDGRSEDGVAVFVLQSSLKDVKRYDVRFQDYGIPQDRVALLLTLQDVRLDNSASQLAVLCTHLTFPHSRYDMQARAAQIQACLDGVRRGVASKVPTIIAGDLNGPSDDVVGSHLREAGFNNVWDIIHRKPCKITHQDHRGRNFASDHVWFLGTLQPKTATLLPDALPDDRPLLRPTVGGAQVGSGLPQTFEDWCELSDHRPVLVSFSILPAHVNL